MSDTIDFASTVSAAISSSEKHSHEYQPQAQEIENTRAFKLVSHLWSWMRTGTGTGKTKATSEAEDFEAVDEKTALKANDEHNQRNDKPVVDKPHEPGRKEIGSAPSREPERDYRVGGDGLWSGGGSRDVPDALRKAAGIGANDREDPDDRLEPGERNGADGIGGGGRDGDGGGAEPVQAVPHIASWEPMAWSKQRTSKPPYRGLIGALLPEAYCRGLDFVIATRPRVIVLPSAWHTKLLVGSCYV